ncbi:MFS transporter [Sorangium sp. So ce1151]|uniref:MFS transporter n=1 Tax=Sorangium sp. So ce1151 TaxID=3133332 RepID=UPI003F62B13D
MTSTVERPAGAGVRPGAFFFLQATAFLSAAGTGLVTPVVPFLAARFAGDPAHVASAVGLLSASYSLCAFFSAPALGALSDATGRRPVLLLSLVGSAAGYALFGFADALPLLFLGRAIDGLTAGNVGTLFAYLGDTSPPEQRARYFGRIGAMFGAGLIAGPALGGLALRLGLKAPFFLAALLTALNAAGSYVFLGESLAPERRARAVPWRKLDPFSQIAGLLRLKHLRPLLTVGVLFTAAFVSLQATFALLAKDRLGWGADAVSFAVIAVGVTDVCVQGILLERLVRAFGDARVLALGLGLVVLALATMALVAGHPSAPAFVAAIVAFAGGEGLLTASFAALLSRAAGPAAQGQAQGGNQALQELAYVVVPLVATQLYARAGMGAPFWVATAAAVLAGVLLRAGIVEAHAARGEE